MQIYIHFTLDVNVVVVVAVAAAGLHLVVCLSPSLPIILYYYFFCNTVNECMYVANNTILY
jgi:hypothetical protein